MARPATVLLGEDDEAAASFLTRLLSQHGYAVDRVADGRAALEHLRRSPPDVALLDVRMPHIDGVDVCRRAKSDPTTRLIPILLMTGDGEQEQYVDGLRAGAAEFLRKPLDTDELLTRLGSLVRMKRYTDDLEPVATVMMTLATMIEADEGYSEGHCHRMANYAVALGQRLGLNDDELQVLRRGAFLHDIGMLAIPASVLHKPAALEPEEYRLVQSHSVIGESLIANMRSLQSVRPIVRHHHERFDGSGYPDGLRGDDIPLAAQIVGLVDAFEAMTSPRPYRDAMSVEAAVEQLRRHVQRGWWRHDMVEHFVGVVQSRIWPAGPPPSGPSAFGAHERTPVAGPSS